MFQLTDDVRIQQLRPLIAPALLMEEFPITEPATQLISKTRQDIHHILNQQDDRLLVIVGPCSIHDPKAALEYAELLQKLCKDLSQDLLIVMRIYFEKPRTTIGWKGLINDPHLNDSFDINTGLRQARKLLLDVNNLGVPAGCEFLDTIVPQYISDLVSWGAIGARTTESQIHRELASGLSMPIGFKNGTSGNTQIVIDAIHAAQHPHHFLSVTKQGVAAIVSTTGNSDCHVILRGSKNKTNYDADSIDAVCKLLHKNKRPLSVMIDCSHGNSLKQHERQVLVVDALCQQLAAGSQAIFGVMLESHLIEGNQPLSHHREQLRYGQSITDACLSWAQTAPLLQQLAQAVCRRRGFI